MTFTPFKTTVGLLALAFSLAVPAQTWPSQSIKIIVPFTPGTGMDTIARAVSPKLSERLGHPVVVQNMPGASGNIGADAVAKANADGYTVLMGANTMLMASQLYKNVPFNPVKDFSSVSMAAWGTLMTRLHQLRLARRGHAAPHGHGAFQNENRLVHAARALPRYCGLHAGPVVG